MILRSLFGKIFAWFWVTMIAVAVATAIAGAFLHNRYGSDRFEAHFSATQSAYAEAAATPIAHEQDREIFEADFAAGPWFGLDPA